MWVAGVSITVGEWVEIGSFAVLAALTCWYARETRKMVEVARATSEAARRSAESAERLLQLEFLPIVWGSRGERKGNGDSNCINLEVHNVGRGAALRVDSWIVTDGDGKTEEKRIADALEPVMGKASESAGVLSKQIVSLIKQGKYRVHCRYYDARGQRYESRGGPRDGKIFEILSDGTEREILGRE